MKKGKNARVMKDSSEIAKEMYSVDREQWQKKSNIADETKKESRISKFYAERSLGRKRRKKSRYLRAEVRIEKMILHQKNIPTRTSVL